VAEHAFHEAAADEVVHQRRAGAGGEDVDVAACIAPSAKAADRRDLGLRRALAKKRDEGGRGVVRIGQQVAAGVALALLERLENQRFLFRAHPAQRPDAAVGRRALEIVERPHVELAMELGAAGVGDFANARRQILADARDFAQARRVERRDLCG
jgi:hypothetical protein